ncbi:LysR substrate-binding domain-containing protein [Gallibacterium anatis]|uniref:LysR substrate-binding domain-containing protein n=1 Tax=Gallibacterium anatis TaxID=750 RepID=UPI0039FD4F84
MNVKLNLEALNIFVQIVEKKSISAAAQSLNLPVSAVSRSLSKLESDLETTLLQRSTRRMYLTAEGELLLQQARQILDSVQIAEEKLLARHTDAGGLLRINTSAPVMRHVLIPAMAEFLQRYSRIQIELNSNDSLIDLLEERTDVAIRVGELQDSSMHARLLGKTAIRILATPQYLAKQGKIDSVHQLLQHRLLGFSQPAHLNQWTLLDNSGHLLTITPSVIASSGESLLALALNHVGVVCLSDMMTEQARKNGELVEILPDLRQKILQPIYAVYYRHRQLSARVALLIDFLSEYLPKQDWCER